LGWCLYSNSKVMSIENKKILWVDDEIEFFKSHIIFLNEKGYNVTAISNGKDAISTFKKQNFDIVLLDEMMPGMDGLETLSVIKNLDSGVPIILITKNEEEWLMDESIASKIDYYLTKPVNPSQILVACKNLINKDNITSDYIIKDYLKNFNNFEEEIKSINKLNQWCSIQSKICSLDSKFETINHSNQIKEIFVEQKKFANKQFIQFIKENYHSIINNETDKDIFTSNQIVEEKILPFLKKDKRVVFLVFDCMSLDQWLYVCSNLKKRYKIINDFSLSILPTATPYSRNSIFSGLLPIKIHEVYSDFYLKNKDEHSMNNMEDVFLNDQLKRISKTKYSSKYFKILNNKHGEKLINSLSDYNNIDLLSIVINFIDILGHKRSEHAILQEMLPDSNAFRELVKTWFEKSWVKDIFENLNQPDTVFIITSDHGSIQVNNKIQIKADSTTSKGLRYKYGKNIGCNKNKVWHVPNPNDIGLPKYYFNMEYIFATNHDYFVYPNKLNEFSNKINGSFQHGGISLDEMITPLATVIGR